VQVGDLPDDQPGPDISGDRDRDGVVGLLRRIDALTAAVLEAASSGARRSSRAGREQPGRL